MTAFMSERERLTYKQKIKQIDLKRIQAIDKLVGKIGIVIGALLLLTSLIFTIIRGV